MILSLSLSLFFFLSLSLSLSLSSSRKHKNDIKLDSIASTEKKSSLKVDSHVKYTQKKSSLTLKGRKFTLANQHKHSRVKRERERERERERRKKIYTSQPASFSPIRRTGGKQTARQGKARQGKASPENLPSRTQHTLAPAALGPVEALIPTGKGGCMFPPLVSSCTTLYTVWLWFFLLSPLHQAAAGSLQVPILLEGPPAICRLVYRPSCPDSLFPRSR